MLEKYDPLKEVELVPVHIKVYSDLLPKIDKRPCDLQDPDELNQYVDHLLSKITAIRESGQKVPRALAKEMDDAMDLLINELLKEEPAGHQ